MTALRRHIALCKQKAAFASFIDRLIHDDNRMTGRSAVDQNITGTGILRALPSGTTIIFR